MHICTGEVEHHATLRLQATKPNLSQERVLGAHRITIPWEQRKVRSISTSNTQKAQERKKKTRSEEVPKFEVRSLKNTNRHTASIHIHHQQKLLQHPCSLHHLSAQIIKSLQSFSSSQHPLSSSPCLQPLHPAGLNKMGFKDPESSRKVLNEKW